MSLNLTDPAFLPALFEEKRRELVAHGPLAALVFGGELGQLPPGEETIRLLKAGLHSLGPGGHLEAQGRVHALAILSNRELLRGLSRLSAPHRNPLMEQQIRETLGLPEGRPVGAEETRRAVLAALLTPLRQKIGSCFATAPAILIQSEAPEQLLADLKELIERGRLTRGNYSVPLSPAGDAGGCPLLRGWEYTLASFVEAEGAFSKGNLSIILGFGSEEEGGVGREIHRFLEEKLEGIKKELEELQVKYETAFSHGKYLEARLARAPEADAKWLQLELRRRVGEIDQLVALREELHEEGEAIAAMPPRLVEAYSALFPRYFQEIYDPTIRDEGACQYDDARAGFRLVYKQGREAPSAWTWIDGPDSYITSLVDFFIATEPQLREEFGELIGELVGVIVRHIRSEPFLESALVRLAKAYQTPLPKEPLAHLDRVERKPWLYLSGGTMGELVAGYLGLEEVPKMRQRRVESPHDLLVFLLDTMKELPPAKSDPFIHNPMASMLMQSPTHAFLFKPGLSPFREGWLDQGNTSTWIRERIIRPAEELLAPLWLEPPMIEALIARLPPPFRKQARVAGRVRPAELRERWAKSIPTPLIDHLLYTTLPFSFTGDLPEKLTALFGFRPKGLDTFDPTRGSPLLAADQLYNICLSCAIIEGGGAYSAEDLPWQIRSALAHRGYALPLPLLFADSNWEGQLFGFAVNPGTLKLDLWRTDYLGLSPWPMAEWASALNGTSPHPWGLFVDINFPLRK
ncbi:MAG: hypothetical protein AB7F31_02100 [Parachlamydiales bacterium]